MLRVKRYNLCCIYFVLYARHTLAVLLLVPASVVQSMHIGTCIRTMMNDLLIKDYKFLARINLAYI